MDENKQFWIEFIELYRRHSCLWDVKSDDYLNKQKRNSSYNILLKKLREINQDASMKLLKKKINNMRSAFRREMKKVQDSKRMKSKANIYEPTLWYYNLLLFIPPLESHRRGMPTKKRKGDFGNNIVDNTHECLYDGRLEIVRTPVSDTETLFLISEGKPTPHTSRSSSRDSNYSHKRTQTAQTKSPVEKKKLMSLDWVHNAATNEEDEYVITGKRIGYQLKTLDEFQRIIAEKLIADVIYHAQMRKLTENASVNPTKK